MSKTVKIIIIVESILILLLGGYLVYDKVIMKKGTDTPTSDENANQLVSLDINSTKIESLKTMIPVHLKNQVDHDKILNSERDLSLIFTVIANMPNSTTKSYEEDDNDNLPSIAFDKADFDKYYKRIFNKEFTDTLMNKFIKEGYLVNKNLSKYYGKNTLIFGPYKENDAVYCQNFIKAEQKNDEIYLYDEYALMSDDGQIFGSDDTNDILINNDNGNYYDVDEQKKCKAKNKLADLIRTYKHTFKENTDGTYYWYSSELVTK